MANVPGHTATRQLSESIWYPAHPPRKSSPEYKQVHHHLVYDLDEKCWICGISHSTGGKMETHHWHIEWALANRIDPFKLAKDVDPTRILTADSSDAWLRQFLDSEGNMLVLCEEHHRHGLIGIHMISYPAWVAQRYLLNDAHDISKES